MKSSTHKVYNFAAPISQPASTTRVNVREFRASLSHNLKQAEAGTRIAVVSHDKIVAQLVPPPAPEPPVSGFGCMRGQIRLAPDREEPDAKQIDIMLNGPIFPDDAA